MPLLGTLSFRHALLSDAANQVQVPGDRTRLHRLAIETMEGLAGGRPPGTPRLCSEESERLEAHATDPLAEEPAEHARLAQGGDERRDFRELRTLYLRRAAGHAQRRFRNSDALELWRQFAAGDSGAERGEALSLAAELARRLGRPSEADELLDEAIALANLAGTLKATNRPEAAERALAQAAAFLRQVGEIRFEGRVLCELATCLAGQGRALEAWEAWGRGFELLGRARDEKELRRWTEAMRAACDRAEIPSLDGTPSRPPAAPDALRPSPPRSTS